MCGIQAASDAGEECRQREHQQLHAELVHAACAGVAGIVPEGTEAQADRAVHHHVGEGHGYGKKRRHQGVVGRDPLPVKDSAGAERAEIGKADRAARELHAARAHHAEAGGIGDDQQVYHLRDGQAEQGHVGARQAQAGEADQQAEHHGSHTGDWHGKPEAPVQVVAEHGGRVSAQGEQRHLRQREHAGDAEQQVPLRGDGGIDQHQQQLADGVAAEPGEGNGGRNGDHHQRRDKVWPSPAHAKAA